jgi:hypothetical protein
MSEENKMNEILVKRTWHKLFESNDSNHEALIKFEIIVVFARRWRTTSQTNDCRCIRSCSSRKAFSSRTYARNASISRIICSFDVCQLCYRRAALAIILDKRSSMFCSFAMTDQRTNKACFEMRERQITQAVEHREEIEDVSQLIDENQSTNSIFFDCRVFEVDLIHISLLCRVSDFLYLIQEASTKRTHRRRLNVVDVESDRIKDERFFFFSRFFFLRYM